MKIRFRADADFNAEIIEGLIRSQPLIDFQTADKAGLRGLPDNKVLEIAAQANRILVSHDRRTMPKHFARFAEKQRYPGVFIISQSLAIGLAIDALLLVWTASEQEEWENLVVDLPL
jgi:hypothetical protein